MQKGQIKRWKTDEGTCNQALQKDKRQNITMSKRWAQDFELWSIEIFWKVQNHHNVQTVQKKQERNYRSSLHWNTQLLQK